MSRPRGSPLLRVVIPALDEARTLPGLLTDLAGLEVSHEVVVVDGGSTDDTGAVAREAGAQVVASGRGRALQMNRGAEGARAPWLLFLHADSRLPAPARTALARWLSDPPADVVAAWFGFLLDGDDAFWRLLEAGQRLRERLFGLVYGDQGLLVRREGFERIGGFPSLPLMEDVEVLRRLRRIGRVRPLPAHLRTSPRRYREEGRARGWIRNSLLMTLYLAGVPARHLARWYPARRSSAPAPRDVVLVFAKLPVPGQVKTRLARDVGPERAAALYAGMGRAVVDRLRGGPYRLIVCHDPPERSEEVAAWLGRSGTEFWPQRAGDLGERLVHALAVALGQADRVCVVGTDAPDLDRDLVAQAFANLGPGRVVLGPARDGGYYLLGLSEPCPALFRDIQWSTPAVADQTRARARGEGLTVVELPPLTDVDTLADLPPALRP
ncbi:MAG: TIGR04283 family arsenosugar biosynthesis glycosyltransferase [Gemmatimonadota bacterium]|nr:TIGR04283 family arsenosugar biosynthesis glycosyltransferase [Gemmatimonadota bacterium]